jgi:hypothetical protein
MRTGSTLLFLALAGFVQAQNWALLNPAYRYNYSNDGTDTISNQIRVMDVDTLGPDSFRYVLNTVGLICQGCSPGYTSGCWFGPPTDLVRIMEPQALGREVLQDGANCYIVGAEDTILIETMATVGSSWISPGGISSGIYAVTGSVLLGTADSLKWIAFSNGDTLALSRNHGLAYMNRATMGRFDLVGMEGSFVEGYHFPRIIDLFDYQVGDVLQYHDESSFQSSFCVHFVDGRTKYEVLARTDQEGLSTYTMERTFYSDEESYYPQMWTPCGTYHYEGQEQISLVVEHDRFSDGNIFNSGLHGQLYPAVLDSVFLEPVSNGFLTKISARVDSLGRYVVEPNIIYTSGWEAPLLCPSNEDSLLLFPNSDGRYRFSYTQGVGLTYLDYYSFESGAMRTLEGYLLGSQQWGTIWSNSAILSAPESCIERTTLFPNPASDLLHLNNTEPSGTFTITDVRGRMVQRSAITSLNERLDVRALPQGAYILMIDGFAPQRFMIVR